MVAAGRITSDVCVIGGGPAGSSVARRIASFGHDVCLIERHASPQPYFAASLPSSILPLLEVIGVRECVEEAGFLRPGRIVVAWAERSPALRALPGPPGFHAERATFDSLLLRNAEANGVRVLRPAQAMRPERLDDGRWSVPLRHSGQLKRVVARFVVDASGGRSLLGGRRVRVSAPLLALSSRLQDVGDSEIEGRVEAGESEWFWYAPLGNGRAVAAVFIDPKRLSQTRPGGLRSTYERLLGRFGLYGARQRGLIEGGVKVCDASSRYAEEPAGDGFIKVGDAGFSLDPLSSQGIQSAVASALQAAIVVNTWARCPKNSELATAFYRERQGEKVQQHARKTAAFYRERAAVCDESFWRQRAVFEGEEASPHSEDAMPDASCTLQLSDQTKVESVPVLEGDIVVSAPALCHAGLERPVAFLGGQAVVPLLSQVRAGQTVEAVVRMWSERLPTQLSWEIMHWLWSRRVVVPARPLQQRAEL